MIEFTDEQQQWIDSHYLLLPVDADGVPIRVGDKIEHRGHTGDVWLFGANEIMCTDRVCYPIGECHIVKPRTLEDVLLEFGNRVCNSGHQWGLDAADVVPQFADEIRELIGGDAQ